MKNKVLKNIIIFVILLIIISVTMPISIATDTVTVTLTGEYNYDYANSVFEIVNTERTSNSLGTLELDKELCDYAMERAAETAIYFDHYRPTGGGALQDNTLTIFTNGENIAAWQRTPQEVMTSWMNSEGHRANILTADFKAIGVGCYKNNGYYYWVQIFSMEEAKTEVNYSGTTPITNNINISTTFAPIELTITGLESVINLSVNNQVSPTGASIMNVGGKLYDFPFNTPISLKDITWETSNKDVATVDESGTITAVGKGQATITATLGNDKKEYTIYIDTAQKGDINKDGKVNISDARYGLAGIVKNTLTEEEIELGDVDGNSKCNISDIRIILMLVVGKIDSLN